MKRSGIYRITRSRDPYMLFHPWRVWKRQGGQWTMVNAFHRWEHAVQWVTGQWPWPE